MNYRGDARTYLASAERELRSSDDSRLRHAALELRMAVEALTYDRALAYIDEFPPDQYDTWQPRKVMAVLLEIDPSADKDSTIAMGKEAEYGVPPPVLRTLGSEKVFNLAALKAHYDALSSFLHVPSLRQARSGKLVEFSRIRARCEEVAQFVREVLSSPVFNVTLGNFASLNCSDCGKPIRKRLSFDRSEVIAECFECQATYTVIDLGEGKCEWQPHHHEVKCAKRSCGQSMFVWRRDIAVGKEWVCQKCQGRNRFVLAIRQEDDQQ